MKNNTIGIEKINFKKVDGLIPAIVQDYDSGTVLMLGFQNPEAYEKTIKTNQITFYSRTKKRLWTKGETSGNFLKIKESKIDCDQDTILYLVEAPKSTCHTGTFSCFGKKTSFGFLSQLFQLVQDRKKNMPKNSYLTSLFSEGLDRIAQKVGEEAIETVIAAKNNDKEDFLNESADLLFHFLVLCAEKDISIDEVLEKLQSRA